MSGHFYTSFGHFVNNCEVLQPVPEFVNSKRRLVKQVVIHVNLSRLLFYYQFFFFKHFIDSVGIDLKWWPTGNAGQRQKTSKNMNNYGNYTKRRRRRRRRKKKKTTTAMRRRNEKEKTTLSIYCERDVPTHATARSNSRHVDGDGSTSRTQPFKSTSILHWLAVYTHLIRQLEESGTLCSIQVRLLLDRSGAREHGQFTFNGVKRDRHLDGWEPVWKLLITFNNRNENCNKCS